MTKVLSLSEVKMKFSELVDGVVQRDDEVTITRNGKPVAVLLSTDEFDSWKETQEIRSNPALLRELEEGLKAMQKGKGVKYRSLDDIFGPASG